MKTLRNLLLVLVAGFALVGCGSKKGENPDDPKPQDPADPTPVEPADDHRDTTITDTALKGIGAGKKIYVTTLGQAEFTTCKDLVGDSEATVEKEDNLLKAADVEKGGVVVLVIGYTGKGISGNITQASEYERVDGFKVAAQAGDLDIITLFLGGKQRRGTNTDAFLESILPVSKVGLIWDDQSTNNGANLDGKIPQFAKQTPVYYWADENDMVDSLSFILA